MRRILPLIVLSACGSSAAGESCAKTGDCQGDLVCRDQICVDVKAEEIAEATDRATRLMFEVERYRIAKRSCPVVLDKVETTAPKSDPWGHDYRVDCTDDSVVISSNGPDGAKGTDDDIVVGGE